MGIPSILHYTKMEVENPPLLLHCNTRPKRVDGIFNYSLYIIKPYHSVLKIGVEKNIEVE